MDETNSLQDDAPQTQIPEKLFVIPSYLYLFYVRKYWSGSLELFLISFVLGFLFSIFWNNFRTVMIVQALGITMKDVVYVAALPVIVLLQYFALQYIRKKRIQKLKHLGSNSFPTCPRCFRSYIDSKTICPHCSVLLRTVPKGERIENEIIPVQTGWFGTKVRVNFHTIPFNQEEVHRVYNSVLNIPFVWFLIGFSLLFLLLFIRALYS